MRIAIINLNGGTGEAVTAVHLAAALAVQGRTLLVDADPQGSALSWSEEAERLPFAVIGLAVRDLHKRLSDHLPGLMHAVVDTPPGDRAIVPSAIAATGVIVVPIPPSIIDLDRLGALSTLSFHETRNFTCGEGGVFILNDASLVERAEFPREKGADRSRFLRGQVDKCGWVDVSPSFLASELVAAYLLAQLEARDVIQGLRAAVWNRYNHELAEWSANMGAQTPRVPQDLMQAPHPLSAHSDTIEPKCIYCPSSVKGNTRGFSLSSTAST